MDPSYEHSFFNKAYKMQVEKAEIKFPAINSPMIDRKLNLTTIVTEVKRLDDLKQIKGEIQNQTLVSHLKF